MKILAGPEGGRLFGEGEQLARPVRHKTRREKAMAFVEAIISPWVSQEQHDMRVTVCAGNDCGHLRREQEKIYCGACGCGKWRLAELRTKCWFAALECPCDPPLWGRI
jgi:hypothetical protein